MGPNDDDLSSQLKAVLAERNNHDAQVLTAAVENALLEGIDPVTPPAAALPGLLAQVRATDRLTHLAPQLAELYDLTPEAALQVIAELRAGKTWVDGPAPGVRLMAVQAGPRTAGKLTALVYLEPGAEFPLHPHLGPEKVLVLDGAYRDSAGEEYWRGELHQSAEGTQHSFRAIGRIPCICAGLNALLPEQA